MMVPGAIRGASSSMSVTPRTLSRPPRTDVSASGPRGEAGQVGARWFSASRSPQGRRGAAWPARSVIEVRETSAGGGSAQEGEGQGPPGAGLGDEDRAGEGPAGAALVGGGDEEQVEVGAAEGAGAGLGGPVHLDDLEHRAGVGVQAA